MKTRLLTLFALVGIMLGFAACGDDPDGYTDPMEWQGFSKDESPTVNVSADGQLVMLRCKNYDGFVLMGATESGDGSDSIYADSDTTWNYTHLQTRWAEIAVQNNMLQVKMNANDSPHERTLTVQIQAGNAWDEAKFVQAGK